MSRRIARHLTNDTLDVMSCDIELEKKDSKLETEVFYHDNFENYQGRIFRVASILRVNFLTPDHWSPGKCLNAVIVSVVMCGAIYSVSFSLKASLDDKHSPYEAASNLTSIAWSVQAIVAMIFIIYWQLYGHLKSYHRHIMNCQHGAGLAHGRQMINSNIRWFYTILGAIFAGVILFEIKYYTEKEHSEFIEKKSRMFYYNEIRWLNALIVMYTYIIWNVTMFLYITYTNTAFLEVRFFNTQMEEMDGTSVDLEKELLKKIEIYGRLAGVIRELDRIFRLYAFLMVVIIIPSVTFTLMMLNQRIHSWKDLVLCMPGICLCAYSFLGVTVAPARLHDEVNRSRSCLLQNASIWFPYRKDIYQIATTLATHLEQYDLGISIWGFAIVSRPLILATMSVMSMLLSLLIELSPSQSLVAHHNHTHMITTIKN